MKLIKIFVVILILYVIYDNVSLIPKVDCSSDRNSYQNGYQIGHTEVLLGGISPCEQFVLDYNREQGATKLLPSDCFCDGYDDGFRGEKAKY